MLICKVIKKKMCKSRKKKFVLYPPPPAKLNSLKKCFNKHLLVRTESEVRRDILSAAGQISLIMTGDILRIQESIYTIGTIYICFHHAELQIDKIVKVVCILYIYFTLITKLGVYCVNKRKSYSE